MKKWGLLLLGSLLGVALLSGCQSKSTKVAPKTSSTNRRSAKASASQSTAKAKSAVAKRTSSKPKTAVASPFKGIVQQTMGKLSGQNSVYIQTTTGQTYQWHNQSQKAASDIKLFILATVYQQVAAGKLNLATTYTLKATDKVGGTGSLQGLATGSTFTIQELLHYMMTVSDNTATNIVIDEVGGISAVNQEIKRLGASQTVLRRKMMDQKALTAGRDNVTSVRDLGRLLMKLWHHRLISTTADTAMLKLMAANTNHTKLPKLLPSTRTVYNKTGEFDTYGVENDAAIFVQGQRAVVLVALSQGGQLSQQVPAMNQLGKQVDVAVFN